MANDHMSREMALHKRDDTGRRASLVMTSVPVPIVVWIYASYKARFITFKMIDLGKDFDATARC